MIMIILYHYPIHGELKFIENWGLPEKIFLEEITMFGKIGVNLFGLISGYLLVDRSFKIKRLLTLDFQCIFFSWLFLMLVTIWKPDAVGIKDAIMSIAPIVFNRYWFITAYFVLYLLTPCLNVALMNMSRKNYFCTLLVFAIIWSIIPCLTYQQIDGMNWSQQTWLIVMYCVGGYFKRFNVKIPKTKMMTIILVLLLLLSVVCFEIIGIKISFFCWNATYFRWSNSIIAFPLSILIFYNILKWPLGYKPIINNLASAALSVYLVHENPLVSEQIWRCISKNVRGFTLVFYSIVVVVFIYGIGIIGHIFYMCTQKIMDKPINVISEKMENIYKRINIENFD